MSVRNDPICQDGCDVIPPAQSFTDCDPEVNEGEVDRIYYMSLGGAPLNDWSDAAEWATRLNNTSNDIDAIRFLNVVGEKPAAEGDIKKFSRNRKIIVQKAHTLPFDVDETNITNYDAMRELECGGNFFFWYQTAGGHLYGGNLGIEVFIDMNDVIPKERTEFELFVGMATWDYKFHPEMIDNPMAA